MLKAFISSTGRDLGDYRQAAIEICNRLSIVPIAMEYFEAMGAGAAAASKRKLDTADVYVGMFAHRYGYIEPGESKAITEIEYHHAGELTLDRLCFVVDPAYPWPPDAIDYEHREQLEQFKKEVSRLVRAEFTTVDSVKVALMQALSEWRLGRGDRIALPAVRPERHRRTPAQPSLLVGREHDIAEMKRRLTVGRSVIVRGWPGVGKTTLVNALAHNSELLKGFPDGVLWISLGQKADAKAELVRAVLQLGRAPSSTTSLDAAMSDLRAALDERGLLLILDDVWDADHAIPFKQVLGPHCALLMTTRFPHVANRLCDNADVYRLKVMSDGDALTLLAHLAPAIVNSRPEESRQLVHDLEGLPLPVRVAGRLLATEAALGVDPSARMRELRESHALLDARAPEDRFDARTGTTPTLDLLLRYSTDALDTIALGRFAMLGAFAAKPATFDVAAMTYIWRTEKPLPTIRTLVDRGLLEPLTGSGRFQIHSLLIMHAQRLLGKSEDTPFP